MLNVVAKKFCVSFCFSFFFYPELTTDLIAFQNMYIYALVAFSTGKMEKIDCNNCCHRLTFALEMQLTSVCKSNITSDQI